MHDQIRESRIYYNLKKVCRIVMTWIPQQYSKIPHPRETLQLRPSEFHSAPKHNTPSYLRLTHDICPQTSPNTCPHLPDSVSRTHKTSLFFRRTNDEAIFFSLSEKCIIVRYFSHRRRFPADGASHSSLTFRTSFAAYWFYIVSVKMVLCIKGRTYSTNFCLGAATPDLIAVYRNTFSTSHFRCSLFAFPAVSVLLFFFFLLFHRLGPATDVWQGATNSSAQKRIICWTAKNFGER